MNSILMITPYLHSQRGNSITASRLYSGLKRMGYAIDLIAMDEPDWPTRLNHLITAHEYGLVHGFHAGHFSRIANHPQIRKLPWLITTTGTDINFDIYGPEREQTLAAMLKADKLVVFNQSLADQITALQPAIKARLAVIPQGVELEPGPAFARQQLGLSDHSVVFIIPSGLRPVKNLDVALDGLEPVYREQPHIQLLIAGASIDPQYTSHIMDRINNLEWASYIGEVPHRHMRGILQNVDIVLNTSLAEGQPQGALEAMSLAKPCILSAVPGNLGIIKNDCHGYYVSSARELTVCALRLATNPHLRHTLGTAAQRLVSEKFSVENELAGYAQLYDEILT
jgi:glycosyltransferase involved in cell wall biosynthesis